MILAFLDAVYLAWGGWLSVFCHLGQCSTELGIGSQSNEMEVMGGC